MELKELFIKLGYKKEEYEEIRNSYALVRLSDEKLYERVNSVFTFLLDNDYSKESIRKMSISSPTILSLSTDNISKRINDLINLGYTKEEIIKMTKLVPSIYCNSFDHIKNIIDSMINLGYNKQTILKMTKTLPQIYSYSPESIKEKIEQIQEIGYQKQEVIKMTKMLPAMLSYSVETMEEKIDNLKTYGYTRQQIINMTKVLPALYGYSIENINEKIEFYDSINMHELPLLTPRYLIQSVALSYARYNYLTENEIEININDYNQLFINNKDFEKKYKVKKQEILKKYDYEEYKVKNNGRTI